MEEGSRMEEIRQIKIDMKDENSVVQEDIFNDFDKSIFKSNYIDATLCLIDILKLTEEQDKFINNLSEEEMNNLIVFTGDRGSGKSSCMVSFSNYLRKIPYLDTESIMRDMETYSNRDIKFNIIKEYSFELIRTIDPSLFENNNNILEVILSNMFFSFKVIVESKDYNNVKDEEKRELLKHFQKVYKSLQTLNRTKKEIFDEEMLDALINIAESTNIKRDLFLLIDRYLEFMSEPGGKFKKKLVVRIDDIDLNTKYAFEMIEQIRKYLMIPNVIILMAVKIDQLFDIVKKENIKDFKELIGESMKADEISNMTERYLEKLIPINRRLYMPTIDIIDKDTEVIINKSGEKYKDIPTAIESLIYMKTGISFINSENRSSYIIPQNLREIKQFIFFLEKMQTVQYTTLNNIHKIIEYTGLGGFETYEANVKCFNEIYSNNNKMLLIEYLFECYVNYHETLKIMKNNNLIIDLELKTENVDIVYNELVNKVNMMINRKEENEVLIDYLNILNIIEKNKFYWFEIEDLKNHIVTLKYGAIDNSAKKYLESFEFDSPEYYKSIESIFIRNINTKVLISNIKKFEDYFINNWVFENLDYEYRKIVLELTSLPLHEKNKSLILNIENVFKLSDKLTGNNLDEYNNIINVENNIENVSLGDVRLVMKLLKLCFDSDKVNKLIFTLETIYTIYIKKMSMNKSDRLSDLSGGLLINHKLNRYLQMRKKGGERDRFSNNYKNLGFDKFVDYKNNSYFAITNKLLMYFLINSVGDNIDRLDHRSFNEIGVNNTNSIVSANINGFINSFINCAQHLEKFKRVTENDYIFNIMRLICDNSFGNVEVLYNLEFIRLIENDLCKKYDNINLKDYMLDRYIAHIKKLNILSECKTLHIRNHKYLPLLYNNSIIFEKLFVYNTLNLHELNVINITYLEIIRIGIKNGFIERFKFLSKKMVSEFERIRTVSFNGLKYELEILEREIESLLSFSFIRVNAIKGYIAKCFSRYSAIVISGYSLTEFELGLVIEENKGFSLYKFGKIENYKQYLSDEKIKRAYIRLFDSSKLKVRSELTSLNIKTNNSQIYFENLITPFISKLIDHKLIELRVTVGNQDSKEKVKYHFANSDEMYNCIDPIIYSANNTILINLCVITERFGDIYIVVGMFSIDRDYNGYKLVLIEE